MKIEYAALTNKGKIRKENQDSLFIVHQRINVEDYFASGTAETDAPLCLAVFDGMGGGQCGREASVLAADTMGALEDTCALSAIFQAVSAAIEKYMKDHALLSMGTTAAALMLSGDCAEICNIGDSGIYCFYQDRMIRLFENHSIRIGTGGKRYLTQYLGINSAEMQIEPFAQMVKLCEGYRFLLCSDGLTDLVSETEIAEIVTGACVSNACKELFARAMQNGGKDNISLILVDIVEVKP